MDKSFDTAVNATISQGAEINHVSRGNSVRMFANHPGQIELQLRHDNGKRVTLLTAGLELHELKALRTMIDTGIKHLQGKNR